MNYRYNVFLGTNGQWYWHLVSGNYHLIAASGEGFTRREDAVRSAALVKAVAGSAPIQ